MSAEKTWRLAVFMALTDSILDAFFLFLHGLRLRPAGSALRFSAPDAECLPGSRRFPGAGRAFKNCHAPLLGAQTERRADCFCRSSVS